MPTFLLYDYSFRPADVPLERAVAWAAETGVRCADEDLLAPDPYPSRDAWCHARVAETEARLRRLPPDPLIVANHFPLRRDHAVLPRIPRFSIWCGTRATEEWHRRFTSTPWSTATCICAARDDRRRALRGSVAGLSEAVESSRQAARELPAADPYLVTR